MRQFSYHWSTSKPLVSFQNIQSISRPLETLTIVRVWSRRVAQFRSLSVLFYFRSVHFSFCSLSVLLMCACVCGAVWIQKGPRYIIPRPRSRLIPTRSRRPDPEESGPTVTLVPFPSALRGRVQVPLVLYLSRSK